MAQVKRAFPDRASDVIVGPLEVLQSTSHNSLAFSVKFWEALFLKHHDDRDDPSTPKLPQLFIRQENSRAAQELYVYTGRGNQAPCIDYQGARWVPNFQSCDDLACDPRAVAIVRTLGSAAARQGTSIRIAFVPSNHRLLYSEYDGKETIDSEPYIPTGDIIKQLVSIIRCNCMYDATKRKIVGDSDDDDRAETEWLDELQGEDFLFKDSKLPWVCRLLLGESLESIYKSIEVAGDEECNRYSQ